MSSHHFSAPSNVGEVLHVQFLSDELGKLYLNEEYSDVILKVDDQRLHAHKVILAARSDYFRALLYGGMRESTQAEIELKDTPIQPLKNLLKYIYTGHMSLNNFKEELILEILSLAHQYGFVELETSISDYLKATLNIKTVCLIYDTSSLFQLNSLEDSALLFMDRNALEVLNHDSFVTLSDAAVKELISRDSFCADEIEIFRAVSRWAKGNPDSDVSNVLEEIRLSLINIQDLLKVVRPTDLMPADILLDAIQSRTESKDSELRYRGYKMLEENVALPKHGASVLVGEVKTALLDGDSKNYDMERGFSRHPIEEGGDKGIVVKLGMPCIINRINMLLWDRDQRSYCYYIDVSMDQKDWIRVVDHSKYLCRSWQYVYFDARVVRYIRVVGTHNTVNKVFHVVTLEALCSEQVERVELGVVSPTSNVATLDRSALVIEGVCRSRNALLNGDTSNYDWDTGYTCHQLGSGAIVVQLGQPYALDSMRLLLWDCDQRSYSYYIEVSTNQRDWEVVCDRTRERCKSWQMVRFTKRPVVFIRIVGTHNTENEVFHCVHFEAPAIGDLNSHPPSTGGSPEPHPTVVNNVAEAAEADEAADEEGIEIARDPSMEADELNFNNQMLGNPGPSHRQQQLSPHHRQDPLQGLNSPLSRVQPADSFRRIDFQDLSVPLAGPSALNPPLLPLHQGLSPGQVMARNQLPSVRGAAGGGVSLAGNGGVSLVGNGGVSLAGNGGVLLGGAAGGEASRDQNNQDNHQLQGLGAGGASAAGGAIPRTRNGNEEREPRNGSAGSERSGSGRRKLNNSGSSLSDL